MTKEEKNARRREIYAEKHKSALRKECTHRVIDVLEENGYHVVNICESSGYFIFDFGGNSVNTFWIKEIPGWRFGLWWTVVEDDNRRHISAEFFTQFEKDVDKFKPSRSTFLETWNFRLSKSGYKLYDFIDAGSEYDPFKDFYEIDIKNMLDFIKGHPYVAWAKSHNWDYDKYRIGWSRMRCWWEYKKNLMYHKKKEWFQGWADARLIKFFKKEVLCFFSGAGIYKHKYISPSYEMYAPFSENRNLFGKCGFYGIFLTEKEIEEFKLSGDEGLRTWAAVSPALEKRFNDKKKRLNKISRAIGLYSYWPEIDDSINVVNRRFYDMIKNDDSIEDIGG